MFKALGGVIILVAIAHLFSQSVNALDNALAAVFTTIELHAESLQK